jgi:inner membrane protein
MLNFPGHFFGGYLAVRVSCKLAKVDISRRLLTFAILAGMLIDFDVLLAPLYGMFPHQHHMFLTHTPFFWEIVFIILYLIFRKFKPQYIKYLFPFAIAIFFHLVLDTPEDGIAWLYPFDKTLYGLYYVGQDVPLRMWVNRYLTTPVALAQEFLVAIVALVVAERTRDWHSILGDIKYNIRTKLIPFTSLIERQMKYRYSMIHGFIHLSIFLFTCFILRLNILNFFIALLGTAIVDLDHLPLILRTGIKKYFRLRGTVELGKPREYKLHNLPILFSSLVVSLLFYFSDNFISFVFFLSMFLHLLFDFLEDSAIIRMGIKHWKLR